MNTEVKNELLNNILGKVSKSIEGKLPSELPIGDMSEGKSLPTKQFFDNLYALFEKNGVYSLAPENPEDKARTNSSRATTYSVKVLNSLLMTKLFKDNIDEFFSDQSNNHVFSDVSWDERESLKSELKDYIEQTLEVDAKSSEAKQLVSELKYGFNLKSYIKGMNCIYNYNTLLAENLENDELSEKTREKIVKYVGNNTDDLAAEDDWSAANDVREFLVSYKNGENEVNPKDFVDHFNNNSLSNDELRWAADIYTDIMIDHNVGFADIMIDGNPLVNSIEELMSKDQHLLMSEVVAKALSGQKVTAKERDGKEFILSPNIQSNNTEPEVENTKPEMENTEPEKEKSWYDYFIDLLVGLFRKMGIISNEQQKEIPAEHKEQNIAEMKDKIEQNRQEYEKNNENNIRQKMSFEEISGKSDFLKASKYSPTNMQKSQSNNKSM